MVTLQIFDDQDAHRKAVQNLIEQNIRFSSWAENVEAQKVSGGSSRTLSGQYAILVDDDR